MPIVIQVDGLIGAGKTTIINEVLVKMLTDAGFRVMVIPEPVGKWKKILPLFYQDKKRWAYSFQTKALVDRINEVIKCMKSHNEVDIYISERGITSDRMFMNILHDDGDVTDLEMEMYSEWWNEWYSHLRILPKIIIYLNTPIELCQQRIIKRGRIGELDENGTPLVTPEYQAKLKAEHDKVYHNKSTVELIYMNKTNVIEITSDQTETKGWKDKLLKDINDVIEG